MNASPSHSDRDSLSEDMHMQQSTPYLVHPEEDALCAELQEWVDEFRLDVSLDDAFFSPTSPNNSMAQQTFFHQTGTVQRKNHAKVINDIPTSGRNCIRWRDHVKIINDVLTHSKQ